MLVAPKGKFRLVIEDPFSSETGLIDDYDCQNEAICYAERENRKRSGPMDCVYLVYDDKGTQLNYPCVSC